jgi:hypothetical protein
LHRRFEGSSEMARRRKSVPMETQPVHRSTGTATQMAHASAERSQAPGAPASVMPRSQAETARKRSLKKQRSMQHE